MIEFLTIIFYTGPRLVAPMLYRLSYGVSRQIHNFIPYKLSNLQSIPPIYFLYVDFYHMLLVNSVSIHYCPRLIPFCNIETSFVLLYCIILCRCFESTLLSYADSYSFSTTLIKKRQKIVIKLCCYSTKWNQTPNICLSCWRYEYPL